MGNDEDSSFDPKTWGGRTQPPGARPASDDGLSFDPSTWGRSAAPAPPPRPAAASVAAPARDRTMLFALVASTLLLIAGALLATMMRGETPVAGAAAPVAEDAVAEAAPVPASRRTFNILSPAELAPALAAAGIAPAQVQSASGPALAALGPAEGEIRMEVDLKGAGTPTLTRLAATRADGSGIVLTMKPDGAYAAEPLEAQLTREIRSVRGEMDAESFYTSAVAAGVVDSLISDFANAFSFDFDLQQEVAPGDIFEAAWEQAVNPQGQPVGPPRLLYVSLSTKEKSRALYRFLPPGETEPGWFDANGRSTKRALMRTPVDGARISSKFGYRIHPILKFQKLHRGTDFAAPTGTPIYAAGDAVVQWAAMKGANGNLTILRHDNGWLTYYLHQSRFMPGIVPGARVTQGQHIGDIGTTGRSTGPHLHYEVHVDGDAVDPQSIDVGTAKPLAPGAVEAFRQERDKIDTRRAAANS